MCKPDIQVLDNREQARLCGWSLLLTATLGIAIVLLNFCTTLRYCALVSIGLASVVNGIVLIEGWIKCMIRIGLSMIIGYMVAAYRPCTPYFVYGLPMSGWISTSLFSLFIAACTSAYCFAKLASRYSILSRHSLSLGLYIMMDGFGMLFFFLGKWPMVRVWMIFYRELAYKAIYASIGLILMRVVFYGVKYLMAKRLLARIRRSTLAFYSTIGVRYLLVGKIKCVFLVLYSFCVLS